MSRLSSSANQVNLDVSLASLIRKLWAHISPHRHRQLVWVVLLMLLSSFAEAISLASTLPLLEAITNPSILWNQPFVRYWAFRFGIENSQEIVFPTVSIFIIIVVLASLIRICTLWLSLRISASIGSDLSYSAFLRTLYRPYLQQVSSNGSKIIATVNADIGRVTRFVLNPLLQLLSTVMIAISLIVTMIAINWMIAVGFGLSIALFYYLTARFTKSTLRHLGRMHVLLNQQSIQTLQEGLGAVRDVLLDGKQEYFAEIYTNKDVPHRQNSAQEVFLKGFPRMAVEPLGLSLVAVSGYLLVSQGQAASAVPLLGALALGAQRLLPFSQKIFESWASINATKASLVNVLSLLDQPLSSKAPIRPIKQFKFRQKLSLKDVHFSYASDQKEVLKGVCLEIDKGSRVGLIGGTGSGKSTLLDLLMGLLKPTAGQFFVDDYTLHADDLKYDNSSFSSIISHVPQAIYLTDSSIAENIAFGVPKDQIDKVRLHEAAKQSQISSFIEASPYGYDTSVGERGVQLSGGQRQRIGIARALYKQPQILFLDEATSALDTETEKAVMSVINSLGRDLTIIIIAHRLSTLACCDRVVELKSGKLIEKQLPLS